MQKFVCYCAGRDGRPIHYQTIPAEAGTSFGIAACPEEILGSFKQKNPAVSVSINKSARRKKQMMTCESEETNELDLPQVAVEDMPNIGHRRGLWLDVRLAAQQLDERTMRRVRWLIRGTRHESWKQHRERQWR